MATLPVQTSYREPRKPSELPSERSTQSESEDDYSAEEDEIPEFKSQNCLFCLQTCGSFDQNLAHMKATHGLTIPYQSYLAVDTITLIWYLHLVIYGYHECLACGTRRRTLEGVQQHMLGKGHCRFEISDDMMEFYDVEGIRGFNTDNIIRPDEESLRLPSGKLLSHRTQTASSARPRPPRQQSASSEQEHSTLPGRAPSDALTPRDRKDMTLATQLSRLSVNDQRSLVHLPASQQRSILAQKKKELDLARRLERRGQLRLERKANKTMMKHFVEDVRDGKAIQY